MKRIFSTASRQEAELLCAALRDRGIDSFLENEAVGLVTPAVPLVVSVDDPRAEEALQVLREILSKRGAEDAPPGTGSTLRCAACGRTLDVPEGEDVPDECPWCGRDPVPPAGPAHA